MFSSNDRAIFYNTSDSTVVHSVQGTNIEDAISKCELVGSPYKVYSKSWDFAKALSEGFVNTYPETLAIKLDATGGKPVTSDQVTIALKNQVFDSAYPYLVLAKNSAKFGSTTLSSSNIACISTDNGPLPDNLRVVKLQSRINLLHSIASELSSEMVSVN